MINQPLDIICYSRKIGGLALRNYDRQAMVLNIKTDCGQTRGQYPAPPPKSARGGMDTVH